MMKVVEIQRPGAPDVLVPRERPTPEPGPGDVLIRVMAAGVNRPDVMQREGRYPPPAGASDIPGLEVAGVVEAVGSEVTRWAEGSRVMALVAGGGYATHCVAPAPQCLPIPGPLSFVEAAAIPETFFTVWTNVFERGGLELGESLLVHGGSSGIGTTAIQLGHAFGARVFATARTAEKCDACEGLGAERAIRYPDEDFVEVAMRLTMDRGVDVILDMVAGDYVRRNIDCLADDGRLVLIALLRGGRAELDLLPILQRRLVITGSTLRPRSVEQKGRIASALEARVWPFLELGQIKPVIDSTFLLERAADAHARMESGEHIGKIVLVVDESSP